MNLITALILFNILILIYQIFIQIFSILFGLTGLNLERSKFQVISILTGTGFTTSESEAIMTTKKRRHLAQNIMLFSYIFNISIVSTFVTIFASSTTATIGEFKIGIAYTGINIILMYWLNKSKSFKKFLDRAISKLSNINNLNRKKAITVFDTYGNKVIAEINLQHSSSLFKSISVNDFGHTYPLQVLVIKREDQINCDIKPTDIIHENDIITVFGKIKDIRYLFEEKIVDNINI